MLKTSFLLLWRRKSFFLTHMTFILFSWFLILLIGGGDLAVLRENNMPFASLQDFFWVIFLFSMTLSGESLFREDQSDGTLALLSGEPEKRDLFLGGRYVALLCLNVLYGFVSCCCLSLLQGYFALQIFLKCCCVLPGFLALLFLMQSLCLDQSHRSSLMPLLVWPFMIPFFIFATQSGGQMKTYGILVALSGLMLSISYWGVRFLLMDDR